MSSEDRKGRSLEGAVQACSSALHSPLDQPPGRLAPLRPSQASREQNRLQFLLKQAEIFQHFAPTATMDKAKKQ